MNKILAVLLTIVTLGATGYFVYDLSHASVSVDMVYQKWKKDFGFSFDSQEEAYRKLIFLENLDTINTHNAKLGKSYELGLNQFAHLSQ